MTKRLPQATKCPSFYWYWPNTCVRLSNVLDESGPDGPTSMWFYNNLLFGQTTNNGERNRVLPFGDWKIDLELPNSMENNAITISFPKEWVKDLCLFCALIKSEDLVIFRMNKTCHSKYLERWHRFCSISHPGEREKTLKSFCFCFSTFCWWGYFAWQENLIANIIRSLLVRLCSCSNCDLQFFNSPSKYVDCWKSLMLDSGGGWPTRFDWENVIVTIIIMMMMMGSGDISLLAT